MSAGPVRQVLLAMDSGAITLHDIGRATGLSPDMVRTVLDHLVRMGAVQQESLATGCPDGGCSGCGSARQDTGTCATGAQLIGLSRTRLAD